MGPYLVRRGIRTAIVLIVASIAVFYGLRFAPGDPTSGVLSATALEEVREAYRERLGLNLPVWVQYGAYLKNISQGDFGTSLVTGKSIGELLAFYGRNSVVLGIAATVLTYAIGLPLGALAAARRNTVVDQLISGISIPGMGMPNFWLCLMLIFSLPRGCLGADKRLLEPVQSSCGCVLAAEAPGDIG